MAEEKAEGVGDGIGIKIGVDWSNGNVVVEFDKQIRWVAVPAKDAVMIAETILEKVDLIMNSTKAKQDDGAEKT